LAERISGVKAPTTESMFEALRSGELARMREARGLWPKAMDVEHRVQPRMTA